MWKVLQEYSFVNLSCCRCRQLARLLRIPRQQRQPKHFSRESFLVPYLTRADTCEAKLETIIASIQVAIPTQPQEKQLYTSQRLLKIHSEVKDITRQLESKIA